MRFWFIHSDEVALHKQIVTQVRLGILSGELGPGEKLPSIRTLARQFGIHSNTVSAAYTELQADRWVTLRRGSGVYVRDLTSLCTQPALSDQSPSSLTNAIEAVLRTASLLGVPPDQIREQFLQALQSRVVTAQHPQELLLIEPDPDLREIVRWELTQALETTIRSFVPIAWPSVHSNKPLVLARRNVLQVG